MDYKSTTRSAAKQTVLKSFKLVANMTDSWAGDSKILKFLNRLSFISWRVIIERFIALGYLLELPIDVTVYATSLTACDRHLYILGRIFSRVG